MIKLYISSKIIGLLNERRSNIILCLVKFRKSYLRTLPNKILEQFKNSSNFKNKYEKKIIFSILNIFLSRAWVNSLSVYWKWKALTKRFSWNDYVLYSYLFPQYFRQPLRNILFLQSLTFARVSIVQFHYKLAYIYS